GIQIEADGNFRVDDVGAGGYGMNISLQDQSVGPNRGWGETMAYLNHEFKIPEMPGGRRDEPLNLGELKLTGMRCTKPGEMIPSVAMKSFDDKPFKLEDHHGKYVVLHFWGSMFGSQNDATVKVLKEIHETFGKDEHFAIVGLAMDQSAKAAQTYAE